MAANRFAMPLSVAPDGYWLDKQLEFSKSTGAALAMRAAPAL